MPIIIEHMDHIYMPNTPNEAIALKDINLTIHDGEFLGLIGHTGSGKTTLVQHINGLLKPTAGRISVYGMELTEKGVDLKAVRRRVGLVFQYPEYQLFEETVEKDIAFGPGRLGVPKEEIPAVVDEAMEIVELESELKAKSPLELSGGQKRRVALAGVIAMRPKTLILDEPMAGLDPQGRKSILRLVKKLHERGTTIIMVSHSMDDLSGMARRVAVMNQGRLDKVGSAEEIFSQVDYLRSIGLAAPQTVELSYALSAKGKDVPPLFTVKDAAAYFAKRIKGC
jgi:energy-coupling factor transport system ATP-binding protein